MAAFCTHAAASDPPLSARLRASQKVPHDSQPSGRFWHSIMPVLNADCASSGLPSSCMICRACECHAVTCRHKQSCSLRADGVPQQPACAPERRQLLLLATRLLCCQAMHMSPTSLRESRQPENRLHG